MVVYSLCSFFLIKKNQKIKTNRCFFPLREIKNSTSSLNYNVISLAPTHGPPFGQASALFPNSIDPHSENLCRIQGRIFSDGSGKHPSIRRRRSTWDACLCRNGYVQAGVRKCACSNSINFTSAVTFLFLFWWQQKRKELSSCSDVFHIKD